MAISVISLSFLYDRFELSRSLHTHYDRGSQRLCLISFHHYPAVLRLFDTCERETEKSFEYDQQSWLKLTDTQMLLAMIISTLGIYKKQRYIPL